MSRTITQGENECLWSSFNCDYLGPEMDERDSREHCPDCGAQAGDGFGMAENDWRYRVLTGSEAKP